MKCLKASLKNVLLFFLSLFGNIQKWSLHLNICSIWDGSGRMSSISELFSKDISNDEDEGVIVAAVVVVVLSQQKPPVNDDDEDIPFKIDGDIFDIMINIYIKLKHLIRKVNIFKIFFPDGSSIIIHKLRFYSLFLQFCLFLFFK